MTKERVEELKKVLTNTLGMEFVLILPGSFMMGSGISPEQSVQEYGGVAGWYEFEHPQHEVKISKPFYLQSTLVTQGQWKRVMGDNPSHFKNCGDDCPVEVVSWDDAQGFTKRINEMEGTGNYRLPTEAEWEYACRAGSTAGFYFGADPSKLGEYAWYNDNSEDQTHPVGRKKPNPWGLYDMHGNVMEWVEDDSHKTYDGAPADGSAWIDKERGACRVFRGGGWGFGALYCRSVYRFGALPDFRAAVLGFRLSRSVSLGP